MKAAIFVKKREINYNENYNYPKLKKDGIIVKVKSCFICGSDVHAYNYETIPPPVVLGHEFSGYIVEIGEQITGYNIGDKIVVQPHIRCGKCYYCRNNLENLCVNNGGIGFTQDGAFAEFVKVPIKKHNIFKIPNNISYEYAALIETYSIALRVVRLSNISSKDNAVIIGAGAVGLFVLLTVKELGVQNIIVIEPNKFNQSKALELGANYIFPPDKSYEIKKLINRVGPDYVFECVGSPNTYIQAFNLVRKAGSVILIGLHEIPFEFNFFPLMLKELNIKTITSTRAIDMQEVISIYNDKAINLAPFITKTVKLKELDSIFKWLSSPKREAVKVLVK
ncbi:MAG: zinc-dependent alcohol dehydrogenase [Candidatus Helarchaeota archaeon]